MPCKVPQVRAPVGSTLARAGTNLVCCAEVAARGVNVMSELDVAKEQIAYLKVWLGILVVTDISVFGWLISNLGTAAAPLLWSAVTAVVALTAGILLLHRRIQGHIESLRGL